ncbi:MAG: histidinol-phosphate transaminase [Bacteroidales bacterium]|nr:histidinol-phosphate transaminase [Bacteroidales bacterium]
MFDLKNIVRPNIWNLKPYSCARDEFQGEASVYLDANESPYNAPYNRYPDPLQWDLKKEIEKIKKVDAKQIFLGNGSDEAIDLVYRAFCEPGRDNVVAIEPTYGMYGVCADINNVTYKNVKLNDDFSLNAENLLDAVDDNTKVIWLCSPNNPTGNLLATCEIEKILNSFHGIVVVDEAYIDFSSTESWALQLNKYPNLIVLQTFSKAWASAGIRLGLAFASTDIIAIFNKIKYPYNINILTQKLALETIGKKDLISSWKETTIIERDRMIKELSQLPVTTFIHPSDANFLLVKVNDANKIYQELVKKGIIVRNRNSVTLCQGGLRITIGTPEENDILLTELKKL